MNRRLGRMALTLVILALIFMQAVGFARMARTANLGVVDEARSVVRDGQVASSVLIQVAGRHLARLAAHATARAATATARVAVRALDSAQVAAGTPKVHREACQAARCNARVRIVHLKGHSTT